MIPVPAPASTQKNQVNCNWSHRHKFANLYNKYSKSYSLNVCSASTEHRYFSYRPNQPYYRTVPIQARLRTIT